MKDGLGGASVTHLLAEKLLAAGSFGGEGEIIGLEGVLSGRSKCCHGYDYFCLEFQTIKQCQL